MAKWQGTVVPNSGYVDKVYFNTKLPLEKTLAILDSLNFVDYSAELDDKIWSCFTDTTLTENFILIQKDKDDGNYYINVIANGIDITPGHFLFNPNMSSVTHNENGWFKDFNGVVEFNMENQLSVVAPLIGFTPENDKAAELFSITPFTQSQQTTADKLQKLIDGKQYVVDKTNAKAETSLPINCTWEELGDTIEGIESGIDTSDSTATANDIRIGKTAYVGTGKISGTIEDYDGAYEGNGEKVRELNIHYGLDEPTDTSKLWVKKDFEPSKVIVNNQDINYRILDAKSSGYRSCSVEKVGNKIYLLGGYRSTSTFLTTIDVFDSETETLTTLNVTSTPFGGYCMLNSGVIGTKIYILGGEHSGNSKNDTIYVFDTENETITLLSTTLPTAISKSYVITEVIGSKIYLFKCNDNEIYIFDTETETVETLQITLTDIKNAMGIAVGTKVYFFKGGYSSVYVFDTETNAFETITTSYYFNKSAPVVVGKLIYIFVDTSLYIFNTETNKYKTPKYSVMPKSIQQSYPKLIDNKIYIVPNLNSNSKDLNMYVYYLQPELAENVLKLMTDTNNVFNIFDNNSFKIEVGVKKAYVGNQNNEPETVKIALHNGTKWVEIN